MHDLNGAASLFIEKVGGRKEVQVEERIEGGKARIWFGEKMSNPLKSSKLETTNQPKKTKMTACKRTHRRGGGPNNWTD